MGPENRISRPSRKTRQNRPRVFLQFLLQCVSLDSSCPHSHPINLWDACYSIYNHMDLKTNPSPILSTLSVYNPSIRITAVLEEIKPVNPWYIQAKFRWILMVGKTIIFKRERKDWSIKINLKFTQGRVRKFYLIPILLSLKVFLLVLFLVWFWNA